MNLEQLSQLVQWLDEEHRRDKAQLADLAAQLDQTTAQASGLNKSLQDFEERLARVQTQSLRYAQLEQSLAQVKTEVNLMLDQYNERLLKREEESFKMRQLERERQDQTIAQVNEKVEAALGWQRTVVGDHDQIKKLDTLFPPINRQIEELGKRLDAHNARIQVAEEWVRRAGTLIAEVQQLADRLRTERAEAAEAARREEQKRVRMTAEWTEQMKTYQREMAEWIAQLQPLQDLPKQVRQEMTGVTEVIDGVKQTESRLNQWQKLMDENRRKETDALTEDIEKRWQQQVNEKQFLRDEWAKRLGALGARVDPLEEWRIEVNKTLSALTEKSAAERKTLLHLLGDVMRAQIEISRQQSARAEQMLNDVLARIEAEQVGQKPKHKARTTTT
jgi:chromosome segregation ATPase